MRRTLGLSTTTLLLAVSVAISTIHAEAEELLLWPDGAPGAVGSEENDRPSLTVYVPASAEATGAAVVICPGGGYGHLAMGHEGHEVARWLNSLGIAAFILKYRIAPRYHHPAPLRDAQRALRTVRARASEWKVDPERIGILGFSAGGHLASSASTHFDTGDASAKDPIDRQSCRPDFAVLVYPVISFTAEFTHRGSRNNFLGDAKDSAELRERFSNEKQVTEKAPPTFLVHTSTDRAVPPENSVHYYLALRRHGVPAELHIYEQGPHGFGLGGKDPVLSTWPERCAQWFAKRGVVPADGR